MNRLPPFLRLDETDLVVARTDRRIVIRESFVLGAVSTLAGLVLPALAGISPVGCLLLAAAAGSGGVVLPVHRARTKARRLRGEFDLAISVLLDLMNIQTAGGSGIETALLSAASLGDGWCFRWIRECLAGAQASRRSYWDALVELGEETGCQSLVEIAHSARMAGEHGARIRQTLASKSSSLRARNLARIEFEAQQRTEQMGLPMVVLFVSFLVFVGYPALAQTMTAV